jgi:hypothetical protein
LHDFGVQKISGAHLQNGRRKVKVKNDFLARKLGECAEDLALMDSSDISDGVDVVLGMRISKSNFPRLACAKTHKRGLYQKNGQFCGVLH